MNNFEKWKQDLTPSKAREILIASNSYCGDCPANGYCKNKAWDERCEDSFQAWAKEGTK